MTEGAFLYRYFEDLPAEGYEWAYGDRAAAGLIPTNDATCVFVATAPAALRRLRRDGSEQAFNAALATAAPGFVERVAAATPAGRHPRLGRSPRLPAALLGTGLGAGRGRRLLQGPDHHPRNERRHA